GFRNNARQMVSNVSMSKVVSRMIAAAGITMLLFACQTLPPTAEQSVTNNNQGQPAANANEKYGFSEAERKQICEELFRLWIQASKLSSEKYPWRIPRDKLDVEKMKAQARKAAEMRESLMEEYSNEVAKKYGVSREQLADIKNEGIEKEWTRYPKPVPEYR